MARKRQAGAEAEQRISRCHEPAVLVLCSRQQAWPQLPLQLVEEVTVRRARRRRRAEGPFIGILVTAGWQEGFLPRDMPSSALRAQHEGQTPPHTSPGRAALEGGVGKGGLYAGLGSWDRRGDVHPHLLARSLSPGTWCCPPRPWSGLADGLHATSRRERLGHAAPEPLVGGGGWRGHAVARAVQTEYVQCTDRSAGRGSLSPGPKRGEVQMAPPCQGQGPVRQAPRAARGQLAAQATPWHGR